MKFDLADTIVALATPHGEGAIGIIRLSGPQAISLADTFFFGKNLLQAQANTIHYGKIRDEEGLILDECLASVFKAPRSYTKEDVIELSCHGSSYILRSILELFTRNGARYAKPGEFTMRAYLNGQFDLTRAEAVADLIASKSKEQHQLAMRQLKGGISDLIAQMRAKLIEFASLLELENDFGEEDVEFADRSQLITDLKENIKDLEQLKSSFIEGNAVKEGIPVAIVGPPNAGKSTLLNALLNEEKAIVSSIPGTTRDVIEDTLILDGKILRFLDTAGLRESEDEIEKIGIERAKSAVKNAGLILYAHEIEEDSKTIAKKFEALGLTKEQTAIIVLTKLDEYDHSCHSYDIEESVSTLTRRTPTLLISAKENKNLDQLKKLISQNLRSNKLEDDQVLISSARHYEALQQTINHLNAVLEGLANQTPSDILALDLRHAMHHLGEISGEIHTDDLLDSIFSNFCIGK